MGKKQKKSMVLLKNAHRLARLQRRPLVTCYTSRLYTHVTPPQRISKEAQIADHSWRQINRIWTEDELEKQRISAKRKHKPKTTTDKIAYYFMKTLYHSFNFITGYRERDPSPKSLEWRLIILESFAGVPG